MRNLTLETQNITGIGTFGVLTEAGQTPFYTVEREWLNNTPSLSCIPAGDYICEPRQSPRWGKTFVLINTNLGVSLDGPTTRTHCLFHIANWPSDVKGCIGIGTRFHPSMWGVADSEIAFNEFMNSMDNKAFKLTIKRAI